MALQGTLERIVGAGSAVGSMVENVSSMSRDTRRIEEHAKHLDTIDKRLDRIVELMERMVVSVEELHRQGRRARGAHRAGRPARGPLPGAREALARYPIWPSITTSPLSTEARVPGVSELSIAFMTSSAFCMSASLS